MGGGGERGDGVLGPRSRCLPVASETARTTTSSECNRLSRRNRRRCRATRPAPEDPMAGTTSGPAERRRTRRCIVVDGNPKRARRARYRHQMRRAPRAAVAQQGERARDDLGRAPSGNGISPSRVSVTVPKPASASSRAAAAATARRAAPPRAPRPRRALSRRAAASRARRGGTISRHRFSSFCFCLDPMCGGRPPGRTTCSRPQSEVERESEHARERLPREKLRRRREPHLEPRGAAHGEVNGGARERARAELDPRLTPDRALPDEQPRVGARASGAGRATGAGGGGGSRATRPRPVSVSARTAGTPAARQALRARNSPRNRCAPASGETGKKKKKKKKKSEPPPRNPPPRPGGRAGGRVSGSRRSVRSAGTARPVHRSERTQVATKPSRMR